MRWPCLGHVHCCDSLSCLRQACSLWQLLDPILRSAGCVLFVVAALILASPCVTHLKVPPPSSLLSFRRVVNFVADLRSLRFFYVLLSLLFPLLTFPRLFMNCLFRTALTISQSTSPSTQQYTVCSCHTGRWTFRLPFFCVCFLLAGGSSRAFAAHAGASEWSRDGRGGAWSAAADTVPSTARVHAKPGRCTQNGKYHQPIRASCPVLYSISRSIRFHAQLRCAVQLNSLVCLNFIAPTDVSSAGSTPVNISGLLFLVSPHIRKHRDCRAHRIPLEYCV